METELSEETKANKTWDALCLSIAEKLEPPLDAYMPTTFQSAEQQRKAECLQIKEELKNNPLIPFVNKGIEHLSNCSDCPEGIALVEALVAQRGELQSLLLSGSDNDAEADIGSVAKQLKIPEEQLEAVEKYAKTVEDHGIRSALFALFIMLAPHRGDYWFCLSLSLVEASLLDLALKTSWMAMTLLPEQPEAYILCATLLSDRGEHDQASPLVKQAEELQKNHPLFPSWELIYNNLRKKFLTK